MFERVRGHPAPEASSNSNTSKSKQKPTRSNAGPTPFHRRESYFPLVSKTEKWTSFKWHIYDNDGSYNGWFDWLPLDYRVGYFSPFVVVSLVGFYISMFWFRPELNFPPTSIEKFEGEDASYFMGMPKTTAYDLAIFVWGVVVVVHARLKFESIGAFFISFTGWSWALLTSRAGFEFAAWVARSRNNIDLAGQLATLGSSLRLVTITNACVVFTIWNFILFPIMYFFSMPAGERRQNFLKFNFSFFMVNIHLLNFPFAAVNILSGGHLRVFDIADLWVSYLVVMVYSLIYILVMDRCGLHFYPIFCPRKPFCVLSIAMVLGLYYFLFLKWNEYISDQLNTSV